MCIRDRYVDRRVAFTGRLYERPADGWWGVTARGAVTLRGLRAWRLALPGVAAGER